MRRFLWLFLMLASTAQGSTTKIIPGGGDLDALIQTCAEGEIVKIVSSEPTCAADDTGAGGADATAIHDDTAGEIAAVTDKATPVAADHLLIEDSAAANAKKDITVGSLEAALEGLMDLPEMQGTLATTQAAAGFTLDTEWDTIGEIETVLGGANVLLETEIDASNELAALMDDETGTGLLCFATSPTFTTGINLGSSGIGITDDGDGAITFLGLGNGFDENLTLNLDDTSNTGVFSSSTSLATLNFSSITLQQTGQQVADAGDTLDFFAATTSAQLISILSDESGTGPALFQDTPTLVTPVIGDLSGMNHAHEGVTSGGVIDGDALTGSGIGGRSVTLTAGTPDTLDADAELYTDDDCSVMRISGGITVDDDVDTILRTSLARTVTRIWCETDAATATINLQRDDGASPANMATADLACDTSGEDACSSGCSTTLVAAEDNLSVADKIDLDINAVGVTPTRLTVCITTTKDD